jgi:hypothetical protein
MSYPLKFEIFKELPEENVVILKIPVKTYDEHPVQTIMGYFCNTSTIEDYTDLW